MKRIFLSLIIGCTALAAQAQINGGGDSLKINYSAPQKFTLSRVDFSGVQMLDPNVLTLLCGLQRGEEISIPGERTAEAMDNLWKEGLFDDIQLVVSKIEGKYIWLTFNVVEKPPIKNLHPVGMSKSDWDDVYKKLKSSESRMFTEYMQAYMTTVTNDFFINKGYLNVKTKVYLAPSTKDPKMMWTWVEVNKGEKVKISDIVIDGNEELSDRKLRWAMKDTKQKRWWNIFKSAKYLESNFDKDKEKVLDKYYSRGYRDAKIVSDSVQPVYDNNGNLVPGRVRIHMVMSEGHKFYFRNITWVGNTKYSSEILSKQLGINKGDVYDKDLLDQRLYMNANGTDVSSLYMDDGYLFFNVTPVEVRIEHDSIDYEMRIYEGRQAMIGNVTVVGNTKTNDHVIMREIRTRPGQLFRRSDIVRSQRELAQLGYFDAEKLGVNPKPNPLTGTVDIEYQVEEKPSDQVELSGGFGANRIVGNLGLSFNNFSTRNFFNPSAWRPLPSGDGQKLSLRASSYGLGYWSTNASFTEPWLGGKKPNSLTTSVYYSSQTNGVDRRIEVNGEKVPNPDFRFVHITGASVGFGMRLKRPDDFFNLYQEINYQHYQLQNYTYNFAFANGHSNNINYRITLSRNSTDQLIYPRSGADMRVSLQMTPPYSYWNHKDYSNLSDQERYDWVEYYKWKFTSSWFTKLAGNLVLNTRIGFGYEGMYQPKVGPAPFERFYLGGSGLTGFALDGREIIALRGYDDQSLSPSTGNMIISKYTWELRYPVSLNPQATVFGLAFAEAGNTWSRFKDFNPFDVYRSAGAGVRVYLPMFGLLGLDWGYRFDDVPNRPMNHSQIHFTIGANLGEL